MNEQLINKLIEYMESSKDFILDQAPDLIKQMLRYETINNIIGTVFAGIIFLIGIGTFICFKYFKRKDDNPLKYFFWVPLWVSFMSIALGTCAVMDLIKIKVAPKYYIIQKLKRIK